MIRKGGEIKTASVESTEWVVIAEVEVARHIDRVFVAAYNQYAGANLDLVEIQILVQFVRDGEFLEMNYLEGKAGIDFAWPASIAKGEGAWGFMGDFGLEAIRFRAKRAGPDPIPVTVEVSFLAEGLD